MHLHDHSHTHDTATTPEQRLALLSYMADHNKSHTDELHELAHDLDEQVAALVHDAVHLYEQGNAKLDEALSMLKGE